MGARKMIAAISFFPAEASGPLSDAALEAALAAAQEAAPAGSRCEVRALDATCLDIQVPPGGPPRFAVEGGALPQPFAPAAATVWLDPGLEDIDFAAQQTARRLHEALGGRGSGVFDASIHLDQVGDGPRPRLQVMATMQRRVDLDRDGFIQYYRTVHVMNAKRRGVLFDRYVTLRLLEAFGDLPVDCVTLLEYDSMDTLRESLKPQPNAPPSDLHRFAARIVYNIGERTLE